MALNCLLAVPPAAQYADLVTIDYKHVRRPLYPQDKGMSYVPAAAPACHRRRCEMFRPAGVRQAVWRLGRRRGRQAHRETDLTEPQSPAVTNMQELLVLSGTS